MVSDVLDILDTDQLKDSFDEIKHQLDELKEQLEQLVTSESTDDVLASQRFAQIEHLLAETGSSASNDLWATAQKLDELSDLIVKFANDYQNYISLQTFDQLKAFANSSKGESKVCKGFYLLKEGKSKKDFTEKLQNYALGIGYFAEAVDDYQVTFPEKTQAKLKSLIPKMMKLSSKERAKDWTESENLFTLYKWMLRHSMIFLIWKNQENLKEQNTQSIYKYLDDYELSGVPVKLQDVLNLAVQQTQELMEIGFDITDPSVITPLGWTANKYPEVAEQCNQILITLSEQQEGCFPPISVDEILTHEF